MKVYVDRIKSDAAVLETEDRQQFCVPLACLPEDIREGSVLDLENGKYKKAAQEETLRRRRLFALQEKLKKKKMKKITTDRCTDSI